MPSAANRADGLDDAGAQLVGQRHQRDRFQRREAGSAGRVAQRDVGVVGAGDDEDP